MPRSRVIAKLRATALAGRIRSYFKNPLQSKFRPLYRPMRDKYSSPSPPVEAVELTNENGVFLTDEDGNQLVQG